MKNLMDIELNDFKEIIVNHKNELQERSEETQLTTLASNVCNEAKGDSQNEVFKHYSFLLRKLSDHIKDFANEDLSSLLSFVEYSKIINDEIIWTYLNLVKSEIDVTRKTLILKIAYVFDRDLMSEEILYRQNEIKNKFPIFWLDLLFYNNKTKAIREMDELLKNEHLSFSKIYPVINRWIRVLKNEYQDNRIIDEIIDFKKSVQKKDQIIFQQWLDENEIFTENYRKITLYSEKVYKETSHELYYS